MLAGSTTTPEPARPDEFGREPFKHPALTGLAGLTKEKKMIVLNKKRVAQLANKYGLTEVLRWKPKKVGHQLSKASDCINANLSVHSLITKKVPGSI